MAAADKKSSKNLIGKGKPGPGRPKGCVNKTTAAIKDMVLQALDEAGGVDYLVEQARKSPTAFMGLVAKVMPTQVVGDPDNPVAFADVTHDAERVSAMIDNLAKRSVEGISLQ